MKGVIGSIALVCALAAPAVAQAETFCVKVPHCEGKPKSELQGALTSAEKLGGSNTILIGSKLDPQKAGAVYKGAGTLQIRGSGAGSSVLELEAPAEGVEVLKLEPESGEVLVTGVTLRVPSKPKAVGLVLVGAVHAEAVTVEGGGASEDLGAALSEHATFTHGAIEISRAGEGETALEARAGVAEVADSKLLATNAIESKATLDVLRSHVEATGVGVQTLAGVTTVEDSLVDMGEQGTAAVDVHPGIGEQATAKLRQDSIVNGAAGTRGVLVVAEGLETKASALLSGSLIADMGVPLAQVAKGAQAVSQVGTPYSSYDATKDAAPVTEGAGAEATLDAANAVSALGAFAAPVTGESSWALGNWHLLASSSLIDAGPPGVTFAPGESETDLEGQARIVNGRRDVGAYEYQRRPPAVSAFASPNVALPNQLVTFDATASPIEPGDSIKSYQWTFDGAGAVTEGPLVRHAFPAVGVHHATVTVADVLGITATATATVEVSTGIHPPVFKFPPFVCATCSKALLLRVFALTVAPRRFRPLGSGGPVTRKRGGMKVNYVVNRAGHVTVSFARVIKGHRRGRACVAARSCTIERPLRGSFSLAAVPGGNTFRFSGRLRGRRLAPGNYIIRVTIIAVGRSAEAVAPFTILR